MSGARSETLARTKRPTAAGTRRGPSLPWTRALCRRLLWITAEDAGLAGRTLFAPAAEKRDLLDAAPKYFVTGYQGGLSAPDLDSLMVCIDRVAEEHRGYAVEGAAMAVAVSDALRIFRPAWLPRFLAGPARDQVFIAHVGIGWSFARVPWARRRLWRHLHPLYRWLAYDGWGFHHGFFTRDLYRAPLTRPGPLTGYCRRAFDQGLGRALWFIGGGDPRTSGEVIRRQAPRRRGDLWSGLGLAAAYTGSASERDFADLMALAGRHRPDLAQGVAFAAEARHRAGNTTAKTDDACRIVWGMPQGDVARVTDETVAVDGIDDSGAQYEAWRTRIRGAYRKIQGLDHGA